MRCKNCLAEVKGKICLSCGTPVALDVEERDDMEALEEALWASFQVTLEERKKRREALRKVQQAEETPVKEEKPGLEEVPEIEETPSTEEVPEIEETPSTEEALEIEEDDDFIEEIESLEAELMQHSAEDASFEEPSIEAASVEQELLLEELDQEEMLEEASFEEESIDEFEAEEPIVEDAKETTPLQDSPRTDRLEADEEWALADEEADEFEERKFNYEAIFFVIACVIIILGAYSAWHYGDGVVNASVSLSQGTLTYEEDGLEKTIAEQVSPKEIYVTSKADRIIYATFDAENDTFNVYEWFKQEDKHLLIAQDIEKLSKVFLNGEENGYAFSATYVDGTTSIHVVDNLEDGKVEQRNIPFDQNPVVCAGFTSDRAVLYFDSEKKALCSIDAKGQSVVVSTDVDALYATEQAIYYISTAEKAMVTLKVETMQEVKEPKLVDEYLAFSDNTLAYITSDSICHVREDDVCTTITGVPQMTHLTRIAGAYYAIDYQGKTWKFSRKDDQTWSLNRVEPEN